MKLTVTLTEAASVFADRHNVNAENVEFVGLPTPAPIVVADKNETLREVIYQIRENRNFIAAIKLVKNSMFPGMGLKDAKDFVETLQSAMRL
jgi:ribosomal protein L7/L12